MTNIILKANGASLSAKVDGKITSGMVGIPVQIEYDSAWDGLTKTVIFRFGGFARVRKNVGTTTTVPWEVVRLPGKTLSVGIEGRNEGGDIVIPTVWATVGAVLPGANGEIPAAPNPDSEDAGSSGGAAIDDSQVSLSTTWSSEKISKEISKADGGEGGVADYIVYVRKGDSLSVVKFDINEAIDTLNNGGGVRCRVIGEHEPINTVTFEEYNLVSSYADDSYMVFARYNENVSIQTMYVYTNGVANKFDYILETDKTLSLENRAADAKVVGERLGDISTALDSIIAIQEELIGGESA